MTNKDELFYELVTDVLQKEINEFDDVPYWCRNLCESLISLGWVKIKEKDEK